MRIGLLGCGTVGGGVLKICRTLEPELEVVRILTLPGEMEDPLVTHDANELLDDPAIDCVVEVMGGIEPAHSFIVRALEAGKSVVTANKAVVAAHFAEFTELAERHDVAFKIEATSGGGVPWIASIEKVRRVDEVSELGGILNGTSNYIIDAMERDGITFDAALRQAQELGYAEADPSADIDGIDVANKAIISSTVAFGSLCRRSIPRLGMRFLTKGILDALAGFGWSVRLQARARQDGGRYAVCVEPTVVAASSVEAHVPTNFNLATLVGATVGELKFYGQGAGALPTGNAVVQDLIDVAAGDRTRYATEETLQWDPALLSAAYLLATSAPVGQSARPLPGAPAGDKALYLVLGCDPERAGELCRAAGEADPTTFCASLSEEAAAGAERLLGL